MTRQDVATGRPASCRHPRSTERDVVPRHVPALTSTSTRKNPQVTNPSHCASDVRKYDPPADSVLRPVMLAHGLEKVATRSRCAHRAIITWEYVTATYWVFTREKLASPRDESSPGISGMLAA